MTYRGQGEVEKTDTYAGWERKRTRAMRVGLLLLSTSIATQLAALYVAT